jgi:hypothetical protein
LSGLQLVEQRLRLFQIERIEAFGELGVDWNEDRGPPWVQLERWLGYYANSHSIIRR